MIIENNKLSLNTLVSITTYSTRTNHAFANTRFGRYSRLAFLSETVLPSSVTPLVVDHIWPWQSIGVTDANTRFTFRSTLATFPNSYLGRVRNRVGRYVPQNFSDPHSPDRFPSSASGPTLWRRRRPGPVRKNIALPPHTIVLPSGFFPRLISVFYSLIVPLPVRLFGRV